MVGVARSIGASTWQKVMVSAADLDAVAGPEQALLDALVVHEGAVRAAQVAQQEAALHPPRSRRAAARRRRSAAAGRSYGCGRSPRCASRPQLAPAEAAGRRASALPEAPMRFPSARGGGRLMAGRRCRGQPIPRGAPSERVARGGFLTPELEAEQPFDRLLAHLHALDPGQPRPRAAEADERLDRLRLALEGRLDAPVRAVAHPAVDAGTPRPWTRVAARKPTPCTRPDTTTRRRIRRAIRHSLGAA